MPTVLRVGGLLGREMHARHRHGLGESMRAGSVIFRHRWTGIQCFRSVGEGDVYFFHRGNEIRRCHPFGG